MYHACSADPDVGREAGGMTGRDTKAGAGTPEVGDETWPALDSMGDSDPAPDLIRPSQLIRYLDRESRRAPDDIVADDEEVGDTSRLPRVLSMPDGIKVEERRVGRAVGQWILHVRCECGRRWFEVDAIDSTTCPRCGVLVYLDSDVRASRK